MSQANYIVSVSGGLSSVEAWRRCLEKHGAEHTIPVFADVGTVVEKGRVVSGEDEDLFRFLDEVERFLGQKCHRIQHPKYKSVWDAFFGERYVTNGRVDTCSKFLKRMILREFVSRYENPVEVLGYGWMEAGRIAEFRKRTPSCWFPLEEPPLLTPDEIALEWEKRGIRRPRMYEQGFTHNNCGGICFKAGLGQAYDAWKLVPHRYEFNERMQERFLSEVSRHGKFLKQGKRHISMKEARLLFESGYKPKTSQYRTCGGSCMVPEQLEMQGMRA